MFGGSRPQNTRLTGQQVTTKFSPIGTRLKKLNLQQNNSLIFVDFSLLAKAICRLEEVNIGNVWLRLEQLQAIFNAVKEPTKLHTIKQS